MRTPPPKSDRPNMGTGAPPNFWLSACVWLTGIGGLVVIAVGLWMGFR